MPETIEEHPDASWLPDPGDHDSKQPRFARMSGRGLRTLWLAGADLRPLASGGCFSG